MVAHLCCRVEIIGGLAGLLHKILSMSSLTWWVNLGTTWNRKAAVQYTCHNIACCLFWPANPCYACILLVEIIFFSILIYIIIVVAVASWTCYTLHIIIIKWNLLLFVSKASTISLWYSGGGDRGWLNSHPISYFILKNCFPLVLVQHKVALLLFYEPQSAVI